MNPESTIDDEIPILWPRESTRISMEIKRKNRQEKQERHI